MPTGAIIGGVASLAGSAIQAGSARSAARSQERAAAEQTQLGREQLERQREIYDDQTERFAPFLDAGTNALAAYQYELGLGERPTFGGTAPQVEVVPGQQVSQQQPQQEDALSGSELVNPRNREMAAQAFRQRSGMGDGGVASQGENNVGQQGAGNQYRVGDRMFDSREAAEAYAQQNMTGGQEYQGISMSPGARFALEQGRDTVEAGAAARGGLQSGATLAGLERLRQGMAAQDREQQLNRIGGLADMGQGAAGMQASAGSNFAQGAGQTTNFMGNALANRGDAQAAGAIGMGNAVAGGLQNIAGMFSYQNALNQPQTQASQLAPTSSQRPRPRPF